MGIPNKYCNDFCKQAEDILSTGKSLAAVCAAFNVTRQSLYDWKDAHPEFKEAIDRGLQKAQVVWEEIGANGIQGNYKNFGAAPWIFTMKNRFREDYKEDKTDMVNGNQALVEKLIDKLVD